MIKLSLFRCTTLPPETAKAKALDLCQGLQTTWATQQRVSGGSNQRLKCKLCSSRYLKAGASLVAQWLRIRLSMQGTRVHALVREDPTCRGAKKPVRHNY